ncbi:NAD(P)-dependent oxidoreductase [Candidatus Kaiserbacteria bacterium]|nr:NAD(P)-dependent oxidoreductase [Candidatus Kaiserbacteria bacterium]
MIMARQKTKRNANFWFGKRVLVTGGDGFLASHLIQALLAEEAVVVTTVRHNRPLHTSFLLKENGDDPAQADIEHINLLGYQDVKRLCDRHQFDTVFHLAASAIVSDAANSPLSTIENNVIPTMNILEAARVNKIPRVIVASSDKSYGDHAFGETEKLPYHENYALRGLDMYSTSKVCTDMIAQAYALQFKLPVGITRCCNMFGPGDLNFTRLIPRTIMRLLSGKPPVINIGNEKVLREYIYVEDAVRANMFIAEQLQEYYGNKKENIPKSGVSVYGWPAFNIGSYSENETSEDSKRCEKIKSVVDIISMLRKDIRNIEPITIEKPSNFIEIPDQFADSSKLKTLGFKPHVSFDEGLERTVAWYKKHFDVLEKIAHRYTNDH